MNNFLDCPVTRIKGIGAKTAVSLGSVGINSIYDLLTVFPVYYINTSTESSSINPGTTGLFKIDIRNSTLYKRYGNRFSVINIFGQCLGKDVRVRIFNIPYFFDTIQKRETVRVFGSFLNRENILTMDNPLLIGDNSKKIIPVYKKTGPVGTGKIEKFINNAMESREDLSEFLPPEIIEKHGFPLLSDALEKIHFPESIEDCQKIGLKERFKYTEFLKFQLELNYLRRKIKKRRRSNRYNLNSDLKTAIEDRSGFSLTEDQDSAIDSIVSDLSGSKSMQRLLMGEVGSGKTVVAFAFLLAALQSGYQGVMIAPTGILAMQHHQKASGFFKGYRVDLLTGNTRESEKKKIIERLVSGETDLVIGTHALIYERVKFKNLSAVVIDEQHRFGVAQRASLFYKGSNCDLLVTTATPIPRTLLISMYDDLTSSKLKSLPSNRKTVDTHVIDPAKRDEFYSNLKNIIKKGRKGYIVIPLVESSENFTNLRSLETEVPYFEKLFKNINFSIISGRSEEKLKERAIRSLKSGKISIIISTTVIEVGMDVNDASFIVIEDADRFGLSQLHQLRGRVGRGEIKSDCFLIPRKKMTISGRERIAIIRETSDGFKIAEIDLKMRGPGLIQGYKQSGRFDFRLGDPSDDLELFLRSVEDSELIINKKFSSSIFTDSVIDEAKKKLKTINFS